MKQIIKTKINNEKELIALAEKFAERLNPKNIIILQGELGAGKTTFVKGIAKYLDISKIITSPTYTIVKEYDQKLCHIDAYRIKNEDIGLDYYIEKNYIIAIEWAENLDYLSECDYLVNIDYIIPDGREITIMENNGEH